MSDLKLADNIIKAMDKSFFNGREINVALTIGSQQEIVKQLEKYDPHYVYGGWDWSGRDGFPCLCKGGSKGTWGLCLLTGQVRT